VESFQLKEEKKMTAARGNKITPFYPQAKKKKKRKKEKKKK
jgi:hypothetical protein